jgi:hypothetical protein
MRPAWLVQEPLKAVPVVSAVWNWSVQVIGPLVDSAPLVWTVTLLVNQLLAPSVPPVTERLTTGAVLSIDRDRCGIGDGPAPLVQEPSTWVPVVSVEKTWSALHVTPLMASAPAVWTVTSLVYQPFAPAVPLAESAALGAVLSILIVTEAELERSALLVAEQVSVTPLSPLSARSSTAGLGLDARPDR